MKKHLSLILCLAMVLTFVPFGTALASDDNATEGTESPVYISTPITITESDCNKQTMVGYNESVTGSYICLGYVDSMQNYLYDINNIKNNSALTWKESWTDGKVSNIATFNGIDYQMIVKSAANGKAGMNIANDDKTFDVADGHYTSIKFLANSMNGLGTYTKNERSICVVLKYKDGTETLGKTESVAGPFHKLSTDTDDSAFAVDAVKMSGSLWDSATVTSESTKTTAKTGYIHVYDVAVDSTKVLDSITVLSEKTTGTQNETKVTLSKGTSAVNADATIFSITAVTTKAVLEESALNELDSAIDAINVDTLEYNDSNVALIKALNDVIKKCNDNSIAIPEDKQASINAINAKWETLKPISVTVDISANAKGDKRAFANENESVLLYYNYLYNHNNDMRHIMDLDGIKTNKNLNWNDNVLHFNDIDYKWCLNSASTTNTDLGSALDLSAWKYYTYNVAENYYDKISMLANGTTAGTPTKGIGVILTYSDGSTEYKITNHVFEGLDSNVKTSSYWKGFETSGLFVNVSISQYVSTAGNAVKTGALTHFVNTYEVEVNTAKTLKSFTVLAGGVQAELNNGKYQPKVDTSVSPWPHAGTNVFAITAVTSNPTINNGAAHELAYFVNSIAVDSISYNETSISTIETLKKMIHKCTDNNIAISNETQTKIDAINAKWNSVKPIEEKIDLTQDYRILPYTDYNKSFYVEYNHLGMYTNFAISLQNMKNDYAWDEEYNVLTWKGVDYIMPVRQAVSTLDDPNTEDVNEATKSGLGATNNGGKDDFTYTVTPNYYEKISIMANGFGGRYSQLQGNDITSGAVIKLTYEDGTREYKETGTIYSYANGNIEKDTNYKAIKVPVVKLSGLTQGNYGTATAGNENLVESWGAVYAYINPYEITVDSSRKLTSVTIVGTDSTANADYIKERKATVGYDIANTNIFAMTAITSTNTLSTGYEAEATAIIKSLDKENLVYSQANFEKISELTKLVATCEEKGITLSNMNEINEMLTAWDNCQKTTMQIVPTLYNTTKANNKITLSVSAKAVNSDTTAVVIFALYNKANNQLLATDVSDKTFANGAVTELSHEFDTSEFTASDYVVKCFVWNSLTGNDALKAYMNPVVSQ